jgi:hypothetical protein
VGIHPPRRVTDTRHPPALSGNLEDLAERQARFDHRTLTPDWYGDRLDPDPILDALLPKRIRAAA